MRDTSCCNKASKDRRINKAQKKLFSKINITPKKVVKEFRIDPENQLEIGTKLKKLKNISQLALLNMDKRHLKYLIMKLNY